MANSWRKSLIRLRKFLVFAFLLIVFLTAVANIILSLYKNNIVDILNSSFFKPVTVDNIFYLPPHFIVFNNLSIAEDELNPKKIILTLPASCATFSLPQLFIDKSLYIRKLYCVGPVAGSEDLARFLSGNLSLLLDFIRRMPKRDFNLSIRQATMKSTGPDGYPVHSKAEFTLNTAGDTLSFSGSIGKNVCSFKGQFGQVIKVEKFELSNDAFNCHLWGKIDEPTAELQGFIFVTSLGLFILDIDSRMNFSFPNLELEQLNFSINNNPVKMTAKLFFGRPFTCDLKLLSNFRGLENKGKDTLKNVSVIASLTESYNLLRVNGSLKIDFQEQDKELFPLEKIELKVKEFFLPLKNPGNLNIKAAQLDFFCKTSTNTYNVTLDGLKAGVYEAGKDLRFIRFSSGLFGGTLDGRGRLEMRKFTPVINAVLGIKNVDANKLEGILIHFSKVYGKLSSSMTFINHPQLVFKGKLLVNNGYLINFEFFKWLAEFFNLPSLKRIPFRTGSSSFIADKDGVSLEDMYLDSDKVKLDGYFKLGESDLVASKISLSLRRSLMQESPKFTPLLKLVGSGLDFLNFKFQLSGNLHAMNFQWQKSDFKDEVQRAIPDFVKKGLEKQTENIISSLSRQ